MNQTRSRESIWEITPINRNTNAAHVDSFNTPISKIDDSNISTFFYSGKSEEIGGKSENDLKTEFIVELPKFENRLPNKFSDVRSQVLQKWVGNVIDIDEENAEFRALIKDVTNPETDDEYVTISYDEISTYDLTALRNGAIFYWTIGYKLNGETKSKFSEINFQRLVVPRTKIKSNDTGLKEFQALFADAN